MNDTLKVVTTRDLCRMFRASRATITRWIRSEGLPNPRKIGKGFYFDEAEILQWWENRGKAGEKMFQPYASK